MSNQSGTGEPMTFAGMVAPDAPIADAEPEQMRAWAISQVLATQAEMQTPIAAFRKGELEDGLLSPSKVADWIADIEHVEGKGSSYVAGVPWEAFRQQTDGSIALPKAYAEALLSGAPIKVMLNGEWDVDTLSIPGDGPRLEQKALALLTPETGNFPQNHHPRAGGVLDELRRLSIMLLETYWSWGGDPGLPADWRQTWGRARAATFILTGYAPIVDEHLYPLPAGRGVHRQSAKHLQLAVFTERHGRQKLAERMAEWNSQYPEWAYSRVTNFGWDSKQAPIRLLKNVE